MTNAATDRAESPPPKRRPGRKTLAWVGGVLVVLAVMIAVLAAIWDWNWFRGPLARMASARLHREVTISGDLTAHLWSWQPSATVSGISIANPSWATPVSVGADKAAKIERLAVQIRILPLLTGHLDMPLLEFDRPAIALYRDAEGRRSWDFSDGKKPDTPLKLPPIRKFVINQGQLSYRDVERKLNFSGAISASEQQGALNRGFEMSGKGELNSEPFLLQVTGGPLLNIDRNKPYPFAANIRAGATYVTADGAVPKPFDMGKFYMQLTARGPDLADLYGLTGVALPNTPPYALHGRLSRDQHLWEISNLGGRLGSSDLNGAISVDTAIKRPFLQANLRSQSLSFPDLGALLGGARKGASNASPPQKPATRTASASQHLFPDATLKVDRLRSLDADVTYKADSIRDAPVHLAAGSIHLKINEGLLTADPLEFALPQGRVAGRLSLDARGAIPITDLDFRLSNARLEQLAPVKFEGKAPFAGAIVGRVKLRGAGESIHSALANSNGELEVVTPGGEIRSTFAELAGVNLLKGLGLLLSKSDDVSPIRCGVAHFKATNGVLVADNLVIDTGPTLVNGSGSINLDTERLDLRFQGHPKKFTLVRLSAPITVGGSLLAPKPGIEAGMALVQGGAALALTVVLSPLAAILPFVDGGLAKNADCTQMMAQSQSQGAPVKSAPTRPKGLPVIKTPSRSR